MKAKDLILFLEKYPDMEVRVGDSQMTAFSHTIGSVEHNQIYGSEQNPDGFVDIINIIPLEVPKYD
jgi:hypothetical protein